MDGHIDTGASLVNQAPITGESIPVFKSPGDKVYAGTLNGEAALEVTVSQLATDSTISRIVHLVEQAQAQRAPIERFIDRFAAWYTPAVVILAAMVAILPPLLFDAPFLDTNGTHGWLYRSLALLIVACPCALVISTPVTLVSALTSLAQRGILVKGGAFLDVLARARLFAFDKTGTLTLGQPAVIQARSVDCLGQLALLVLLLDARLSPAEARRGAQSTQLLDPLLVRRHASPPGRLCAKTGLVALTLGPS